MAKLGWEDKKGSVANWEVMVKLIMAKICICV